MVLRHNNAGISNNNNNASSLVQIRLSQARWTQRSFLEEKNIFKDFRDNGHFNYHMINVPAVHFSGFNTLEQ